LNENKIDIRRHVQLAAAELAHADHDQLVAAEELHAGLERKLGEVAHRRADFVEPGVPGEVARHHAQQHRLPQPAQPALELRFAFCRGRGERARHLVPGERLRRNDFRGKFRARGEEPRRIARKGGFLNGFRHSRSKMAA